MLSVSEIKTKINWHKEEIRICEGKISNSKRELELYKQDLARAESAERQRQENQKNSSTSKKL